MNTLHGKIALVTGAGRNIGRAIALALARDGATVMVNTRADVAAMEAVVAEIEAAGGRAVGHLADVSDPRAIGQMAARLQDEFGGLDIVVSNAGLREMVPFLQITIEQWRRIMSVALEGAFHLAQAAIPMMQARGGGSFVALSGISTHVGMPGRVHVSVSKSGLEALMRSLASEFATDNIRFNCVAPGAVDTARGAAAGPLPQSLGDRGIPLQRKADVEEIAAVVRMLAGPEGGYVTGQVIHVNGGAHYGK